MRLAPGSLAQCSPRRRCKIASAWVGCLVGWVVAPAAGGRIGRRAGAGRRRQRSRACGGDVDGTHAVCTRGAPLKIPSRPSDLEAPEKALCECSGVSGGRALGAPGLRP
eukprot:scaffold12646_cov115-Isochrysis_galbana.AAC.2